MKLGYFYKITHFTSKRPFPAIIIIHRIAGDTIKMLLNDVQLSVFMAHSQRYDKVINQLISGTPQRDLKPDNG